MIRFLLRLLGLARPQVPCWCGSMHNLGTWHDPSHGQVDRDIQDRARDLYGYPPYATKVTMGDDWAKVIAAEQTMQAQRAEGKRFFWEKADR